MGDWIKDVALLAFGGIGTAVWFFWRRRAEQKPVFENIQKAEKLLALRKQLDSTSYTIEDLKRLEDSLMGRAEAARELGASYEQEAEQLRRIECDSAMTQAEMNIAASHAYERSERRLESTILALKEYLSPHEVVRFEEAHTAWRQYQRQHTEFVASRYEGGSIQPLVYASALDSVTIARMVELEVQLQELKDTCIPYRERVTS